MEAKRIEKRSEKKLNRFSEEVYQVVRKIPKGRVATYGQVAVAAGRPLATRSVGSALHQNSHKDVPCHRVVNYQGRLAPNFGKKGYREQKRRFSKERVTFKSQKLVDLKRHQVYDL